MESTDKEKDEEFIETSKNILKGKTGEDLKEISPLDEMRKLNKEMKKMREDIELERMKVEKAKVDMMLGGYTIAGQTVKEVDPHEEVKNLAKKAVESFYHR